MSGKLGVISPARPDVAVGIDAYAEEGFAGPRSARADRRSNLFGSAVCAVPGPFPNQNSSTMMVAPRAFIGIEGAVVVSAGADSRKAVGRATMVGFPDGLPIDVPVGSAAVRPDVPGRTGAPARSVRDGTPAGRGAYPLTANAGPRHVGAASDPPCRVPRPRR
ncbi:MAG: hypothetical protein MR051_02955 [Lentisphaeria bacterium]|nr:hypothetical protein [Lentisphaeria bacterium]